VLDATSVSGSAQEGRSVEQAKMWQELWAALALMLVIEGMLPFISPAGMRQAFAAMAAMDDRTLRFAGLLSMAAGVILLYTIRA
jgi:uncharacterized protein YjeT (DUF2065 family)